MVVGDVAPEAYEIRLPQQSLLQPEAPEIGGVPESAISRRIRIWRTRSVFLCLTLTGVSPMRGKPPSRCLPKRQPCLHIRLLRSEASVKIVSTSFQRPVALPLIPFSASGRARLLFRLMPAGSTRRVFLLRERMGDPSIDRPSSTDAGPVRTPHACKPGRKG